MHQKKGLVYVWPLCTRIIHWMLALSFLFSFITAFFHHYFTLHSAFGYLFGVILLFRLLWGFIGPDYGTFMMFTLRLDALRFYFEEKVKNRWRKIHPGHNPASSWFTLIVLSLGLGIVFSGLLLYGIQEGSGLFGFLNANYFSKSFYIDHFHRISSFILLAWAFIHIMGVLIEQFYHKTQMVFAMLSGYKRCEGDDTSISFLHQLLAYSAILLACGIFYTVAFKQESLLTNTIFQKRVYAEENHAFDIKCGKCHKHYPPFMLPQASWEKLMDGLSNHFGEEILEHNISKPDQKSIRAYLVSNSAESSTHKLAFKTLESLGEMRPISITKSPYWREAHRHIDDSFFKHPEVKDKSNCFVCHQNFEYGIFDNALIRLP